jgi:multiple sugar transport system permease protein
MKNYLDMLGDPIFWNGLVVTFELFAISLTAQLGLGLYIALLLHRSLKGSRVLRTVLLSPLAMPPVAVGMMWLILLDPSFGPANYFLELLGLEKSLFLASPDIVIRTLAGIDTWQYTPFVVLILLGGLQALPEEPYEAAEIDGASRRQMFFHITLPLLKSSIVTASILRSIDLLRFFDTIYITTQGGPGTASTTLNVYAYRTGFVYFRMGYAAALMITLMALVLLIVIVFNSVRRSMR